MHHFPLLSAFPSTFLANTAVRGDNQEDMKWEQEKAAKCGLFFMTRWLVLLFPPLQADNEVCFRITTPRTKPIRNTYLSCCSRQTVRWDSAAVCGFERRHQCPPPPSSVSLWVIFQTIWCPSVGTCLPHTEINTVFRWHCVSLHMQLWKKLYFQV